MKRCFSIVILLVGLALLSVGCVSDAQVQAARDDIAKASSLRAATTQQISQQQAYADTLPPGKVKDDVAAVIVREQKIADAAQKAIDAAQGVINAAQTGNFNQPGITNTLGLIPGVGPYAGLIALVATAGVGYYKTQKYKGATSQLAQAVSALPTDHQDAIWTAVDQSTRKVLTSQSPITIPPPVAIAGTSILQPTIEPIKVTTETTELR